jgi:hypothetical protein
VRLRPAVVVVLAVVVGAIVGAAWVRLGRGRRVGRPGQLPESTPIRVVDELPRRSDERSPLR